MIRLATIVVWLNFTRSLFLDRRQSGAGRVDAVGRRLGEVQRALSRRGKLGSRGLYVHAGGRLSPRV
jgi:hypothetical protein